MKTNSSLISRHFNGVNNFYSIFMVHKENQVSTMNFVNAVFMAMKIKINSFSGLFHDFLTKAGFIVVTRLQKIFWQAS